MDAPGAATFSTSRAAYDNHIGRYSHELAQRLIDAAEVRPGDRALDVGCGTGGLTEALLGRLGSEGVAAVDPSDSYVQACRERLPDVDVRPGVAEALPFGGDCFDAALAQLVVNFMADPVAGVGEMARVTRPGGMVAGAVWDYAGGMTLLRTFWDAAAAVDPAALDRHEGRSMRYCTPDELRALWTATGLTDVRIVELLSRARYEDYADLWRSIEGGAGPSSAYVAGLDPERRAAVGDELRRRLGVGPASFTLEARAWCALGRVAGRG